MVLVVDDEQDIRDSLKELMEGVLDGVEVIASSSGQEALLVLDTHEVDLIISDYKMPGMSGIEFLTTARHRVPGVPRVLLTAFPDLELAIRAVNEARIDFFLTKPVDPMTILDTVRELLPDRAAA